MKIVVLVENTACVDGLKAAHGLSLYIETAEHRILFDVGPGRVFLENAEKLGVDIAAVDTVVLSHGHDDHTGGLAALLEVNPNVKVYIHKNAFADLYAGIPNRPNRYIGTSEQFAALPNVTLVDHVLHIDDTLTVFGNVQGRSCYSHMNDTLYVKHQEEFVADDFSHEQNLIIREGDRHVLIAGCAHCGVLNILADAECLTQRDMDAVLGGFHLVNPAFGLCVEESLLEEIAEALLQKPGTFYTGHCTGEKPYRYLKSKLKERMEYIPAGRIIEF